MTLTLIHTSDWHLGHELAGHPREAEHEAFLAWLLGQLDEQEADVLLVTGDIYDVANPPVSAMRRLYAFLAAASARRPGLLTVILGGNHDSAARINLPAPLLDEARVRFVGNLPRKVRPDGEGTMPDHAAMLIPLPGKTGEIAAWLAAVPFCRPGDLGAEPLQSLYAGVAAAGAERAGSLPLILSGHLHVAGGAVSELSERRIVVGGEEAQAASLFDPRAAYVALGHLHRAQDVAGPCPIRYAGSPFPLSATERDYAHSISVLRVSPGKFALGEVPIPRPVPFLAVPARGAAPLDAVVAELEALPADEGLPRERHPFLEVTVAVDGPEPHLQARVLAALDGKAVRLTRILRQVATAPDANEGPLAGADLGDLAPEAVFAALHGAKYGGNPPPDDLARAFAELLIEVNTLPAGEPA
ncbi:exonuclease SbcCD subunit D C-terminal domain-containing protein [Novosphingobium bradum]|uniref:Nuclease SbcCD subunit D n=1 Tax=Novosphingobium bradum TaxID=1737444 RepID=A0ABV7IQP5_9SPHN